MELNDFEIAIKYSPHIYFDIKEPFYPKNIGYTIFYRTTDSYSFNRKIEVDEDTYMVIEYALYWDFDIGHLYELEHIWVYVNIDGDVIDAEASFHGHYFKSLLQDRSNIENNTHVRLYSQPGKHAFMPKEEYFHLIPNLYEDTYDRVGVDGLLVNDLFIDKYSTTAKINFVVKEYMQQFRFKPTMQFEKKIISNKLYITWDELKKRIPKYINDMLDQIMINKDK